MFQLPELPYAVDALEPFIDAQTMTIHHDKHHGTYVTNLNDLLKDQPELLTMDIYDLMSHLSKVPDVIRGKVRNNGGGHANHTFFWSILGSSQGGMQSPSGKLKEAIDQSFGSHSSFQESFEKAAIGRFGSGWAWLISENGKLSILDTPNQDNPWMEGKTPILGVDVWEHAYYLKYQNRRAEYLKAFWNVVNWKEVEKQFEMAT